MKGIKLLFYVIFNLPFFIIFMFYCLYSFYIHYKKNTESKDLQKFMDDVNNINLDCTIKLEPFRFYINYFLWIVIFYYLTMGK